DQDDLPLLGRDSPHADQAWRRRDGCHWRFQEERVEPAPDQVDLLPVRRIGAVEDLAAPKAADRRDEVAALDLLLGPTATRRQDLLGAVVHGVAERRPAQLA